MHVMMVQCTMIRNYYHSTNLRFGKCSDEESDAYVPMHEEFLPKLRFEGNLPPVFMGRSGDSLTGSFLNLIAHDRTRYRERKVVQSSPYVVSFICHWRYI